MWSLVDFNGRIVCLVAIAIVGREITKEREMEERSKDVILGGQKKLFDIHYPCQSIQIDIIQI